MSEIEKLYELANIKKQKFEGIASGDYPIAVGYEDYPPFTAEKQIELIKLLQRKNGYKFSFSSTNDNSEYLFFAHKDNTPVQDLIVAGDKCYEEALASFINNLWQSLTEEEKQKIKEILK